MREYILKQEALNKFTFYQGDRIPEKDIDGFDTTISFKEAKRLVKSIPPADVLPVVRGEWIWDPNGMDFNLGAWLCSKCSCQNNNLPLNKNLNPLMFSGSNFCPNCGADMRGNKDET